MRPAEPALRAALAADDANAEKIVEAAAVESHHDNFAALKNFIERQADLDAARPDDCTCPSIRSQTRRRLDVEVFGEEINDCGTAGVFRLGGLVDQILLADR